ncbi:MAG: sulfotransferase [Chloroflexi bacterium]|nr:sulfotransferase [Chloroflexota bacterium]MCI0575009.1 sulfotransferase [Chloroflexota bacterium]MCI0645763.1 sulfotransferase [Chloroflexota bacterium]MCI0727690.1 sulfotransferase [Chloroflexota bacterium]
MSAPAKADNWPATGPGATMLHPAVLGLLNKWQVGRRPLLIAGHGRSGTTWVGNVFATARRALYCFEPGSPVIMGHGGAETWFRYLQPGDHDRLFEQAFDAAFRGLPYGRRWRRAAWHRLLPGYRIVVKEVAAFMCLEWLAGRYDPAVLVVIRHPCPTILSELKQGTDAERSRQAILHQSRLWAGPLEPYRAVLESAQTPLEILAAIWASRHRVLADALACHPEWQVVFYEALCAGPVAQFRHLFQAFGLAWTRQVEQYVIHSSTNHALGLYSGKRLSAGQADKWQREMTPTEIESIRCTVDAFALPFYRTTADWVGVTSGR